MYWSGFNRVSNLRNTLFIMTDYVALFQAAAEAEGYKFFYGAKGYHNFEMQNADLTDGSIILIMFPASETPVIERGIWSRYTISTQFHLGRKFESETLSSVSETELQKYTNRLSELRDLMDTFITENIGCATNLEAKSIRYFRELNQLSANIDVISCEITFEAW